MTEQEILKLLYECDFHELTEDNYYDRIYDGLPPEIRDEVIMKSGVSKCVLLFPNTDFAIKIPFSGFSEAIEEYDQEREEYYYTGDIEFIPFRGAKDCDDGSNYCAAEQVFYQEVLEFDEERNKTVEPTIAHLFAETIKIGEINGCPIYKQPICETYYDSNHEKEQEEKKIDKISHYCKNKGYYCFNLTWLSDVVSFYGFKVLTQLLECINHLGIEDLHNENIGYRNGQPVIFDYAGYYD